LEINGITTGLSCTRRVLLPKGRPAGALMPAEE